MMRYQSFYDPEKTYEENYLSGPFGPFADDKKIKRRGEPKVNFLGHQVYLPFGIPAGPLLNSNFVKAGFAKGFDICIYKTIRTRKHACHQWPNVLAVHPGKKLAVDRKTSLRADQRYQAPLSITNSFGVPSMEPDVWQADMNKAVRFAGKGQVMVGSFQGTSDGSGNVKKYVADFVLAAKLVKEAGAKILEANLSCPNEGTANVLCFDLERTAKIAEAIKNEIGDTPLILKMAYFSDDGQLERFVRRMGRVVDGLSAINTIAATIVDKEGEQALPGAGRQRSGVCGASIKWAGLDMVERLVKLRKNLRLKFSIVGVGGVTKTQDYSEYRSSGADAVMAATGAMWNPYLAQEIYVAK